MSSEKRLREIAHAEVTMLARNPYHAEPLWEDHPELTEDEWDRVVELIDSWPILELPTPDRDGYLWPERGRAYGNVHISHADPTEIVISRGGPGEVSRHTSMTLTRAEALELASLLAAVAWEAA